MVKLKELQEFLQKLPWAAWLVAGWFGGVCGCEFIGKAADLDIKGRVHHATQRDALELAIPAAKPKPLPVAESE